MGLAPFSQPRILRAAWIAFSVRLMTLDPNQQLPPQRRNIEGDEGETDRDHPESENRQETQHAAGHAEQAENGPDASGNPAFAPFDRAPDGGDEFPADVRHRCHPLGMREAPRGSMGRPDERW